MLFDAEHKQICLVNSHTSFDPYQIVKVAFAKQTLLQLTGTRQTPNTSIVERA
jgi:hypothetical protein